MDQPATVIGTVRGSHAPRESSDLGPDSVRPGPKIGEAARAQRARFRTRAPGASGPRPRVGKTRELFEPSEPFRGNCYRGRAAKQLRNSPLQVKPDLSLFLTPILRNGY